MGLAVDVGSTTIAAHLCDLASGECVGFIRNDESTDPIWRGFNESGVICDDAPGWGCSDDRCGAFCNLYSG